MKKTKKRQRNDIRISTARRKNLRQRENAKTTIYVLMKLIQTLGKETTLQDAYKKCLETLAFLEQHKGETE